MSSSNYLYPKYERTSVEDPELRELLEDCNPNFVSAFCHYFDITYSYYEDDTGARFFMYHDREPGKTDMAYVTADKGFLYYAYYTEYRDDLIKKFKQFKKLKAFL